MFVQAWRWQVLLGMFSIRLPLRTTVTVSLIGLFGSLALPGTVGLELIRTYYAVRHAPDRKIAASVSVLLDRVLGLFAFLLLSSASLVWLVVSHAPGRAFAAAMLPFTAVPLLAIGGALAAPALPRARRLLLRLVPGAAREPVRECVEAYTAAPGAFAGALALSILAAIPVIVAYLLASRIAGVAADWLTVASVAPVVVIAGVLPITPQGIGVVEASAAVLFLRFGVENGATIALVNRLWALALGAPGSVLYALHRPARTPAPDS